MRDMLRLVAPPPGARVIDLGGTWEIWDLIPHDFDVTLVNTCPWPAVPARLAARYQIIVADACGPGECLAGRRFDLAFSNSVIEHVGGPARRGLFAQQVKRLAPSWWVQTPEPSFPIEAHTGLPGYWRWPDWARARADRIRREHLPEWHEEVASTAPVHEEEMGRLFPEGSTYRERVLGLVKSYALYRPFPRCPSGPAIGGVPRQDPSPAPRGARRWTSN